MKEGSLIPADATSGFLTVRTKPKSRECAKLQSYPGTGWSEPLGLEGQGLGEGALRFTDAVSHSTTGPIRKPNSWTEGLATHRQWLDRLSLEQGRCWTDTPSPDAQAFRFYSALEEGSLQSEPWECPQLQSLSSHTFHHSWLFVCPTPPPPFSTTVLCRRADLLAFSMSRPERSFAVVLAE